MASLMSFINRLLPFATPGTPLAQDLLHLATICGLLYYAPQIQEWVQRRRDNRLEDEQDIVPLPELGGDQALDDGEHPAANDQHNDVNLNNDDDAPEAANDHLPEAEAEPGHVANEAGAAGPAREPNMPTQRNVGAKKAKSMARRDQRRAYHEFQRSQGEAQRAADAEGAAEREAVLAAERERRRAAEAALEAKKAKEREHRREQERKEREEDIRRRELAVSVVRRELEASRTSDLFKVAEQVGGDVDEEWVEKILKASGIIGRKGDVTTMITSMGWAVRVSREDMATLYRTVVEQDQSDDNGRVSYDDLGGMLETVLQAQYAH